MNTENKIIKTVRELKGTTVEGNLVQPYKTLDVRFIKSHYRYNEILDLVNKGYDVESTVKTYYN